MRTYTLWLLLGIGLLICSQGRGVNQLNLISTMAGEFYGSRFGFRIIAMDYNGDGYDDLIVCSTQWNPTGVYDSTQYWGKIYFYWGGPDFDNVADFEMPGVNRRDFSNGYLINGGDINGDGIDDLVIEHYSSIDGKLFSVYYGCSNPTGVPDMNLSFPVLALHSYYTPKYLGDINGDGHADLSVSCAIGASAYKTYVWTGIGNELHELGTTTNDLTWNQCDGVGDVNGDGFADYLLQHGISGGNHSNVRIVLFYGSQYFPQRDSLVISENTHEVMGSRGGCALGDLNQDGNADFTAHNGRLWLGGDNLTSTPDLTIDYLTGYYDWYTLTNNSGPDFIYGDLNNDGYDDVIGSSCEVGWYDGEVRIWLGGANMEGSCDLYLHPPSNYEGRNFGWSKAAGDFNGDGICDLAVSAPWWGQGEETGTVGKVFVYSGNPLLVANEDLLVPVSSDPAWQIDIFPNPVSRQTSKLNLQISGTGYSKHADLSLELYNLKGQKLLSKNLRSSDAKNGIYSIEGVEFSPGVYLLRVKQKNGVNTTGKFIVY